MKKNIETEPLAKIDYVEAVDALSMAPVEKLEEMCIRDSCQTICYR